MEAAKSDDSKEWPTHAQAAHQLGVSVSTVRRLRVEGRLEAQLVEGVWRFDPKAVDDMIAKHPREEPLTPADRLAMHAETTMQDVIGMLLDNNQRLFKVLGDSLDRAQTYIEKLETSNHAQREAAENALSQEQDRAIARNKADQMLEIQKRAASSLIELGFPLLAHKLGQKIGFTAGPPGASPSKTNGAAGTSTPGISDAAKLQMADGLMLWLSTLSAEAFEKLCNVLPSEHVGMIAALYASVKGSP